MSRLEIDSKEDQFPSKRVSNPSDWSSGGKADGVSETPVERSEWGAVRVVELHGEGQTGSGRCRSPVAMFRGGLSLLRDPHSFRNSQSVQFRGHFPRSGVSSGSKDKPNPGV